MSSSTEPKPSRFAIILAIVGFVLCDGAALVALGNLIGVWAVETALLAGTLAVGVVCLVIALLWRGRPQ